MAARFLPRAPCSGRFTGQGHLGQSRVTPGSTIPALLTGPTTDSKEEDDVMNIKDIAATLAILGSGALAMTGCGKDKPATEVPAGDEAAAPTGEGEAKCGEGHAGEGHCGDEAAAPAGEGEAAPEGEGEGSCGGK